MAQRTYLAIDLKSYYASAECAARHLDPLTTNLVVADASRTEKTICLAVSPSLKSYGIPGRARLFEVVQRVKEVNNGRLRDAIRNKTAVYKDGVSSLSAASYDATALAADPSLEVSYLVAPPRMAYYEKVSRQICALPWLHELPLGWQTRCPCNQILLRAGCKSAVLCDAASLHPPQHLYRGRAQ